MSGGLNVAGAVLDDDSSTVRVALKPRDESTGHVDGAWWPHSDDLPAEASALLPEIARRRGRPLRLSFDSGAWRTDRSVVFLGDNRVRLDGFTGRPSSLVHLIDVDGRVLTLLVVPHDMRAAAALRVMSQAARPGNKDTPPMLLRAGGNEAATSEQRWESEGGSMVRPSARRGV